MSFWQIPNLDGRSALANRESDEAQETDTLDRLHSHWRVMRHRRQTTLDRLHSHSSQEMPDLGTQAPQEICDP